MENIEEADVAIGDFGDINDAAELFIEDAQDAGIPVVLSLNNTKPTQYAIENSTALLYLSYSQGADHGSIEGGFVTTTAPWVYVDLLYGDRQPGGVMNKEIARDTVADNEQWKDLAGDGLTTAEAKVDGETVAKKIMTVEGGSWRVVQMDVTIAEAGDHEITIGDIAPVTIKIAE